jgi:hypothetical protein
LEAFKDLSSQEGILVQEPIGILADPDHIFFSLDLLQNEFSPNLTKLCLFFLYGTMVTVRDDHPIWMRTHSNLSG